MPELRKMLYSSLENTANSIVPRRRVRFCIDFKCLPASPLDGERMSNGRRASEYDAWLKANRSNVHDLRNAPDA
jgi:hypothetical protein